MENSQIEPELPEPPAAPVPEETTAKPKHNSPWSFFIRLIACHPWLLVVALLATFVGSTAIALYSLGTVGRVEQWRVAEETEVEVVESPNPPAENTNPLPLWMVIAIALSCAGGCLFIFRFLNSAAVPQKSQKRNRYQVRQAKRNQPPPPEKSAFTEPRATKNPPVFVPPQLRMPIPATSRKTKTVVTILPLAPSKPLTVRKETLADSLDIRKQSSLSAILHKY